MDLPQRKNIRLKDYDYSQNGAYFITICATNRINLFGLITVGQGLCSCRYSEIELSMIGQIIKNELLQLETRYNTIKIDKYVIMPNHIHAIFIVENTNRQEQSPCPTIMDIVCAYKSITTKLCNKNYGVNGSTIWQTRFHDHIIRNEAEYLKIREYIDTNLIKWQDDCYYELDDGLKEKDY